MKESQKIVNNSEKQFELAQVEWKNKQKDKAEEHFKLANYGMMKAYLVSEGIMHMDSNNSIHDAFEKQWRKDPVFSNSYAHELNYFDQFNNKRGYFNEHPELDTQLKNDFSKLYNKLHKIALSSIKKNDEDKFVPPDDIIDFVNDVSNLTKGAQPVASKVEAVIPEEKPEKKGFFKSLFGNIKIDIEVNGKKKK